MVKLTNSVGLPFLRFSTRHSPRSIRSTSGNSISPGGCHLKASTVAQWIHPHPVPAPALDQQGNRTDGPAMRTYGFDIDTLYAGIRGERFDRATTLGHTGFTGTAFWIDPPDDCYFILLTNSVHPEGKGNVLRLRHQVATVVAEALLGPAPTTQPTTEPALNMATVSVDSPSRGVPGERPIQHTLARKGDILTGIDVLIHNRFAPLVGHKIGLVTNHSGRDRDGNRTIDLLAHAPGVTLVRLFSPEHGIDGILDQKVANDVDAKTGLKIFSLYGPTQKPTPQMLEGIDTLVYDIQDAGARFYTYITTLGLCMQAAGASHVRVVVLDRPNPINGITLEGNVLEDNFTSFVGQFPLPVRHAMTIMKKMWRGFAPATIAASRISPGTASARYAYSR